MEECCIVHLTIVDSLHLRLIEPLDALAILPKAVLKFVLLWYNVRSESMLFSLEPVALVAPLISPGINSEAMFLIILILALIHAAVVPDVDAHAFHVIVEPFALVLATI